jgi:hypothetical protein
MKWLLPQNRQGRLACVSILIFLLTLYIFRLMFNYWQDGFRLSLGLFALICIPFVLAFSSLLLTIAVWSLWVSIKRARHPAPFLIYIVGIVVMFVLPLISLPHKPFPEEIAFSTYRTDYEDAVRLAQENLLLCHHFNDNKCVFYVLPTDLAHLSNDGRVYVFENQYGGLDVTFNPFFPSYAIIYESGSVEIDPCFYHDAVIERQLDDHWFLCTVDWN